MEGGKLSRSFLQRCHCIHGSQLKCGKSLQRNHSKRFEVCSLQLRSDFQPGNAEDRRGLIFCFGGGILGILLCRDPVILGEKDVGVSHEPVWDSLGWGKARVGMFSNSSGSQGGGGILLSTTWVPRVWVASSWVGGASGEVLSGRISESPKMSILLPGPGALGQPMMVSSKDAILFSYVTFFPPPILEQSEAAEKLWFWKLLKHKTEEWRSQSQTPHLSLHGLPT